jgi:hypothetical protein
MPEPQRRFLTPYTVAQYTAALIFTAALVAKVKTGTFVVEKPKL